MTAATSSCDEHGRLREVELGFGFGFGQKFWFSRRLLFLTLDFIDFGLLALFYFYFYFHLYLEPRTADRNPGLI